MTTQEYEVRAWLGPISAETDDETVQAIMAAWDRINEVYGTDPESDDVEGAHEASTRAAMWILGDTSIRKQLREWQKARRVEQLALDQLKGAMIAADLHGEPIARIAAEVGITRPTVYSWLGKA